MSNTESEFDRLSWHDCHIWGLEIRAGEPALDDWTSELAFQIDFIVEWLCPVPGGTPQFRVAPAELTFHGVTDPRILIESDHAGFQVAVAPLSIDSIKRERIEGQRVYLDRPYYRWTIILNSPRNGLLEFGAFGFTQRLLTEPVTIEDQHLSRRMRQRLISTSAAQVSKTGQP